MFSQASSSYFRQYGVLVAVVVAGAGLVAAAFTARRLIAPRRPLPEKLTTYECGIDPVGEGWSQTQIRYYIYAFLFVIFDVESVFLFPWATVFEGFGYTAVVEMAIFIGILAIGLLYAWKKGVLRWVEAATGPGRTGSRIEIPGMTAVSPAPSPTAADSLVGSRR